MRGLLVFGALLGVVLPAIFLVQRYRQPLPALAVSQVLPESATPLGAPVALPWPKNGSAAIAVDRLGIVDSTRDDRPRPIASVAKIMTAYVVLKNHPLKAGEKGPSARVTDADIRTYNEQLALDESVVTVQEGQMISEYDLLQGLLIPSGNNLAFLLARWDAGSVDAFVGRMNAEAAALGMKSTRYADPSGALPATTSTASDQLLLIQAAMANPVFAEIVAKPQTQLPMTGVVYNVNERLGRNGIIGVKTGWTEEAGGCFTFAANAQVDGRSVTLYGAVIGQDTLKDAFDTSERLIETMRSAPRFTKVLSADAPIAEIASRWGQKTRVLADGDLEFLLWPGMKVVAEVELSTPALPLTPGAELGTVVLRAGGQSRSVPLKSESSLTLPGRIWRLVRR